MTDEDDIVFLPCPPDRVVDLPRFRPKSQMAAESPIEPPPASPDPEWVRVECLKLALGMLKRGGRDLDDDYHRGRMLELAEGFEEWVLR